jgi:hypothetical protein
MIVVVGTCIVRPNDYDTNEASEGRPAPPGSRR